MTYDLSNGGRNYLNRNDYLGDLSVKYLLSGSVYVVKLSDFSPKVIFNDLQHIKIAWQLPGSVELNQTFSVVGTEMDWNITFRNGNRQSVEITDLKIHIPIGERDETLPAKDNLAKHIFLNGHSSYIYWLPFHGQGNVLLMTMKDETSLEYKELGDYYYICSKTSVDRTNDTWRIPSTSKVILSNKSYTTGVNFSLVDSYNTIQDKLYDKGNIVAMTGDGVNDAPALKQADIGVAMGITGSEVSKDAAAMVLTDDNFATIIKAVENGRNVYKNIKGSIQFLLSGNFGGILAVLYASLAGLPVPFAPVHLLFINLLTDSLPAIALGLEPHTKTVMDEKPRPMNESILTKDFLIKVGTEGFCIGLMTMLAFLIGYRGGDAVLASTMAFGTLCTGRLVHGFNCKSDRPMMFSKKLWNNIYLIGAFLIGFVLITSVLTIPALQNVFKVVPLNVTQLFTVYGLALLNLPVIQLLKWIRKRR